jgi:hypothetical protein
MKALTPEKKHTHKHTSIHKLHLSCNPISVMGSDGKKRLSVTLFMSNCLLTQVFIYTNWKIIVAIIKLAHSSKKSNVLQLSFFPWEDRLSTSVKPGSF